MGAVKEFHHEEIERRTRVYDITDLQKMTPSDLHDLADSLGVDAEIKSKQGNIYAILNKQ